MWILVRVVLWPVRMALTVLEWIVLFVAHFVGIGCYLLAALCVVIAAAGGLMGLAPVEETVKTLGIGFGFFALPFLCEGVTCFVLELHRWVRNIIG